MKRHWKKIAIAIAALVVVVIAGSFVYAKIINKADPAFGQSDVDKKLASSATVAGTTPASTGSVDGTWNIESTSEVGYRVKESISGFDTTANGRTQSITGSMVVAGTSITQAQFTVDMTTFTSDESRRDGQFNTRVMDVAQFPTSTFVTTAPIDFGAVPAEGGTVNASATGDLTLHGTTKSVTFDLQGTLKNSKIGILGQIPVVFADYGIPAPSFGSVSTEDHGLLEFVLVMQHA